MTDLSAIAEAYRWQRSLGHRAFELQHARIVTDLAHPEVWDANHVDTVTAETPDAIEAVLAGAEMHLAHCRWRVVDTDHLTPQPFLARLALDGFEERPAVIQMELEGTVHAPPTADVQRVETDADWRVLGMLVRRDHEEGVVTGGMILTLAVTQGIVAGYRAKGRPYRLHLARINGEPVAYGAMAVAPSGAGMIEDLFTLPSHRRRGIASGMIATFAEQLRKEGCKSVFLGAQAGGQARHLYAKLGFRPVMLTRCWVKNVDGEPA